jgi:hypothetical protein
MAQGLEWLAGDPQDFYGFGPKPLQFFAGFFRVLRGREYPGAPLGSGKAPENSRLFWKGICKSCQLLWLPIVFIFLLVSLILHSSPICLLALLA